MSVTTAASGGCSDALPVVSDLNPEELQLAGARMAFQAFGKGRHPAALDVGDCFSDALAAHFDVPLLCTGNDLARTGISVVPTAQ